MSKEKTPEEAARSKRAHANSMIAVGLVTTVCALAGSWIALSGHGERPDWMFGGSSRSNVTSEDWVLSKSQGPFVDWNELVFKRADTEGKLIFLFIGPSYNAPTERLYSQIIADSEFGQLLDRHFISVRARSELFPDLDRRYRSGGWPTVALLFPSGLLLDSSSTGDIKAMKRWLSAISARMTGESRARVQRVLEDKMKSHLALNLDTRMIPVTSDKEAAAAAAIFLKSHWNSDQRRFESEGVRFPYFERLRALSSLPDPWALNMVSDVVKGTIIFQDPADGGFRRMLAGDSTPIALEKVASIQADALDALCLLSPTSARKTLHFLDHQMKSDKDGWYGWIAGYSIDSKTHRASDRVSVEEKMERVTGTARLGDLANLARAVYQCSASSEGQKGFAKKVVARQLQLFSELSQHNASALLLDDATAVGEAALSVGQPGAALSVWEWMEARLGDGPVYFDRPQAENLPRYFGRMFYPELNLRALRLIKRLKVNSGHDQQVRLQRRENNLKSWLSARQESLDPVVWSALLSAD
jgi:hypothetical protein